MDRRRGRAGLGYGRSHPCRLARSLREGRTSRRFSTDPIHQPYLAKQAWLCRVVCDVMMTHPRIVCLNRSTMGSPSENHTPLRTSR